jgi:pimeloyl-ACP methyl ester carboxylesterase
VTTPWVQEDRIDLDGRSWAVRQTGDPSGRALVYFHGTPSCRLEPAFADADCADLGVRLVSFDRPGYGESTPQRFGLASVAAATAAIADRLGLERFSTLGQSGGGPFSLAGAAVLGERVVRCGVTGGAVPFQLVPGAMDLLDDNDRAAVALLPDQEAAAAGFARGFEGFRALLRGTDRDIDAGFRGMFGPQDRKVLDRSGTRQMVSALRASMVHGTTGAGWDNAAWIGPWDIDLSDVRRPVHLWYGGADRHVPAGAGPWLADHLPDATLRLREDDGHLGVMEHTREILETLRGD